MIILAKRMKTLEPIVRCPNFCQLLPQSSMATVVENTKYRRIFESTQPRPETTKKGCYQGSRWCNTSLACLMILQVLAYTAFAASTRMAFSQLYQGNKRHVQVANFINMREDKLTKQIRISSRGRLSTSSQPGKIPVPCCRGSLSERPPAQILQKIVNRREL